MATNPNTATPVVARGPPPPGLPPLVAPTPRAEVVVVALAPAKDLVATLGALEMAAVVATVGMAVVAVVPGVGAVVVVMGGAVVVVVDGGGAVVVVVEVTKALATEAEHVTVLPPPLPDPLH